MLSPLKITRAETQGRREKTCGELLNAVERSRTIRVLPHPCRIFIHRSVPWHMLSPLKLTQKRGDAEKKAYVPLR